MITICTHRDFESSWMSKNSIDIDDYSSMYVTSLYLVTTTLSTCGFGDLSATHKDTIEYCMFLIL